MFAVQMNFKGHLKHADYLTQLLHGPAGKPDVFKLVPAYKRQV
jgi:hypothetical protein